MKKYRYRHHSKIEIFQTLSHRILKKTGWNKATNMKLSFSKQI